MTDEKDGPEAVLAKLGELRAAQLQRRLAFGGPVAL